jgi:hypothetical protein
MNTWRKNLLRGRYTWRILRAEVGGWGIFQLLLTRYMVESEDNAGSVPWMMILVGIIASVAGVFVVLRFQGYLL